MVRRTEGRQKRGAGIALAEWARMFELLREFERRRAGRERAVDGKGRRSRRRPVGRPQRLAHIGGELAMPACSTVTPAAMVCPPPFFASPASTAPRTAAPISTPAMERAEPVASPVLSSCEKIRLGR